MLSMKDYNAYWPTTPYNGYNIFTTSIFTNRMTPGALLPALTKDMCISWVPQLAIHIWEVNLISDKLLKGYSSSEQAVPHINKMMLIDIPYLCLCPLFLCCVSRMMNQDISSCVYFFIACRIWETSHFIQ
jgi:hypothetical protein